MQPFKESMPQITSPYLLCACKIQTTQREKGECSTDSVYQSLIGTSHGTAQAKFLDEIQTKVLLWVFLLAIHSLLYNIALKFLFLQTPGISNVVSTVQLLHASLRNPYRNLKSENSQDYAQKPQWNCTFMYSAFGMGICRTPPPPQWTLSITCELGQFYICIVLLLFLIPLLYWSQIHEHTISLRFLGIIWRVLRLEVSVWIF
jgi:hypothetical protein